MRRASLTTSMVITPTYWKPPLTATDTPALTGGSVASRAERSKQRQLHVSLGDLSGGGDLLHLNELKGPRRLRRQARKGVALGAQKRTLVMLLDKP